jgi:hypothetical protein
VARTGRAPIAAISERFAALARRPMSCGDIAASVK